MLKKTCHKLATLWPSEFGCRPVQCMGPAFIDSSCHEQHNASQTVALPVRLYTEPFESLKAVKLKRTSHKMQHTVRVSWKSLVTRNIDIIDCLPLF